jgi:hypothetical protein
MPGLGERFRLMQYPRKEIRSRRIRFLRITRRPERLLTKFRYQLFDCTFDDFIAIHIYSLAISVRAQHLKWLLEQGECQAAVAKKRLIVERFLTLKTEPR